MKTWIEIQFWKFVKYIIRRGYGANCPVSDLDEFKKMFKKPMDVFHPSRCGSCRAKEIIDWIDGHIELIK